MQVLNKGSFCVCAGVFLIDCRASAYSAQLTESEACSLLMYPTLIPQVSGLYLESSRLIGNDHYITAKFQVVSGRIKVWAWCNLSFWVLGCVFICGGGSLHIYCIIVAPAGDPRPLQACPPSCFISICSYMGIFLPSARLHYVRFLNNPPSLQISLPLPPSHTYTLLLMLVSYGQSLFPVQEVMWLILIWSPVLMACIHDQQASTGCVLFLFVFGCRFHL